MKIEWTGKQEISIDKLKIKNPNNMPVHYEIYMDNRGLRVTGVTRVQSGVGADR